MKNKFLFCLSFSFLIYTSIAQPPIQWEANFGGSADDLTYDIQQTADGGYAAIGYTFSNNIDVGANNGESDLWIVKMDADGALEWEKTLGGSEVEYSLSGQQTSDGGYILGGRSESDDGDVSGNNGNFDFWIVKLDASGELEWEQNYGGSANEWPHDIQQTADGGFIMIGLSNSSDGDVQSNNGSSDFWIVKTSATGSLEWENNFGGSDNDHGNAIRQTSDGGYIATGLSSSNDGDIESNNGGIDIWTIKLDASGNLEWEKNLGGSGNDWANSIEQTNDGGYIIGGITSSNDGDVTFNNGNADAWVIKLDSSGTLMSEHSYGGTGDDGLREIHQTPDLGFISIGASQSNDGDLNNNYGNQDSWVFKLDATWNIEWEQNYGGSEIDWGISIQTTNDGGYILGNSSNSSDNDIPVNNGGTDLLIIKLEGVASSTNDQEETFSFDIQPNPSEGSFSIFAQAEGKIMDVVIYDILGSIVYKNNNVESQIDIEGIAGGVYFVSVGIDERRYVRELVVR